MVAGDYIVILYPTSMRKPLRKDLAEKTNCSKLSTALSGYQLKEIMARRVVIAQRAGAISREIDIPGVVYWMERDWLKSKPKELGRRDIPSTTRQIGMECKTAEGDERVLITAAKGRREGRNGTRMNETTGTYREEEAFTFRHYIMFILVCSCVETRRLAPSTRPNLFDHPAGAPSLSTKFVPKGVKYCVSALQYSMLYRACFCRSHSTAILHVLVVLVGRHFHACSLSYTKLGRVSYCSGALSFLPLKHRPLSMQMNK